MMRHRGGLKPTARDGNGRLAAKEWIAHCIASIDTTTKYTMSMRGIFTPTSDATTKKRIKMAAALAAFAVALQGAGLATPADIQNAIAPLAAQVALLTAQVAALPTLAQIQAAMAAALAPHNAPAIAAAAAATVQAITTARARNAHDRSGEAYAVVPRADGTPPPSWPAAGFTRHALFRGGLAVINALLADYGLPVPADTRIRRDALASHIGTTRS
jgi:hypothetical protein